MKFEEGKIRREMAPRLKRARLAVGLTQETVAKEFGMTRQAVAGWESGTTTIGACQLAYLCQLYGVSSAYLLLGFEPWRGPESREYVTEQLARLDPELADRMRLMWMMIGRLPSKQAADEA